jgi:hypothetical protein
MKKIIAATVQLTNEKAPATAVKLRNEGNKDHGRGQADE